MPRTHTPGNCPECGALQPGRIALRNHRYDEHGIHWDKKRAPRGTPNTRKEWTGVEVRFLQSSRLPLIVLARRLSRSFRAVQTKLKRLKAESVRRADVVREARGKQRQR
jgi:hypothetical protein